MTKQREDEQNRLIIAILRALIGDHYSKWLRNTPIREDRFLEPIHNKRYKEEFKDTLFAYEPNAQGQLKELIGERLKTFLLDLEEEGLKINPNDKKDDEMIDLKNINELLIEISKKLEDISRKEEN